MNEYYIKFIDHKTEISVHNDNGLLGIISIDKEWTFKPHYQKISLSELEDIVNYIKSQKNYII